MNDELYWGDERKPRSRGAVKRPSELERELDVRTVDGDDLWVRAVGQFIDPERGTVGKLTFYDLDAGDDVTSKVNPDEIERVERQLCDDSFFLGDY
jgi:hypothetical protein